MEYYTKQYCIVCGKTIKIDALDFLMNLDKPVVCEKCKKIKKEEKNNANHKIKQEGLSFRG